MPILHSFFVSDLNCLISSPYCQQGVLCTAYSDTTIFLFSFQGKFVLLTGADAASMKLELYTKENQLVCALDNDSAVLGSYPVEDYMRIHVSIG